MTRPIIIAALLLAPSPTATATTGRMTLPQLEALAESHHGHPAGLLARVRRYEGDTDRVYRRRGVLICGRYQVNAGQSWRLCRMARGPAGTWIAAQLLEESREWCAARRCPCPEARWNWRDRTALCAALGGES